MKFFDVLKYLGLIILITFLIFWYGLNQGNNNASLGEAVLYYFWNILIIFDNIFDFNKDIKKNNEKNN